MKDFKAKIMESVLFLTIMTLELVSIPANAMLIAPNLAIIGNYVEFESSLWNPQEQVGSYSFQIISRQGKIVQEEYYNASVTIENKGLSIFMATANVSLSYGANQIIRSLEISGWRSSSVLSILIPFLPSSEKIIWEQAFMEITWNWTIMGKNGIYVQTIPIRPKNQALNMISPDDSDTGNLYPSKETAELALATGPIIDAPDAEITDARMLYSTYSKGNGPQIRFRVKFYETVSGFYYDVGLRSHTYSWTTESKGHYFNGPFSAGSTYYFTFKFGWSIAGGKYVFGQGNYQLEFIRIYNGANTWSDYESGGETNDQFSVSQATAKHVVFMHATYDSYVKNNHHRLHRSASQFVSDGTTEFEEVFSIDYYVYLRQHNWLSGYTDWKRYGVSLCGGIGNVYVNDGNNDAIKSAAFSAHSYLLDLPSWTISSNTVASNHGYDEILSISGLVRSYLANHGGDAGYSEKNWAWVMAGVEYGGIGVPIVVFVVGDNVFDNLIQHELSHRFGAEHDNSANNVMKKPLGDWNNWLQTAINTINSNIGKFDNPP